MAYFSNGTEGMMYEEKYCNKCIHLQTDEESGFTHCPIMDAHLQFNYDQNKDEKLKTILDILIPPTDDGLHAGECSMFKKDRIFEQPSLLED